MPRTFDLKAESSSSVEQFRSAFGDEAYRQARLAAMENGQLVPAVGTRGRLVGPDRVLHHRLDRPAR